MPFPTFDTEEEIPEAFRDSYTEQDGRWVLDPAVMEADGEENEEGPMEFPPGPLRISHEDAQDPRKYRRAKALAEERGQELVVDARPDPAPVEHGADVLTISKADAGNVQTYRAAKERAEKAGKRLVVVDSTAA